MTLYEGEADNTYKVESVNVEQGITRRLEALGINEGTNVQILNRKNHGAMVIKVRGTRLALGKSITKKIEITKIREAEA